MRAYQLPKGGAGIEALVRVDLPQPKPQYRQVLVKVGACSLNFRDLGIVRGTYRMSVRDKVVPLSDGAGEVVELGAGVSRAKMCRRARLAAVSTACSPNTWRWRKTALSKFPRIFRSKKVRRCLAPR